MVRDKKDLIQVVRDTKVQEFLNDDTRGHNYPCFTGGKKGGREVKMEGRLEGGWG